jgi:hypothetical protein
MAIPANKSGKQSFTLRDGRKMRRERPVSHDRRLLATGGGGKLVAAIDRFIRPPLGGALRTQAAIELRDAANGKSAIRNPQSAIILMDNA